MSATPHHHHRRSSSKARGTTKSYGGRPSTSRRPQRLPTEEVEQIYQSARSLGGIPESELHREHLEGHGTPTPSEKVSRWHRDIFLVSPNGQHQQVHPRQCICDQCMAEYGTYKFYNQVMQHDGGKEAAKKQEDTAEKQAMAKGLTTESVVRIFEVSSLITSSTSFSSCSVKYCVCGQTVQPVKTAGILLQNLQFLPLTLVRAKNVKNH